MAMEKSSILWKDRESIASSITLPHSISTCPPPTHYETYLLRLNPPLRTVKSTTHILSLPLVRTYNYTPASYYIKPLASSTAEICAFLDSSNYNQQKNIKGKRRNARKGHDGIKSVILSMEDDAQREIQKLIEARETATCGPRIKRVWEVVGICERGRRRIRDEEEQVNCHPVLESGTGKRLGRKKGEDISLVEWVLVLRARVVDCEERVMPVKYGNPFYGIDREY